MIDVNITLGHWPFRKTPAENVAELALRLRRAGITQAWVGSFEGLFQRDVAGVNLRLADDCRKADAELLLPFGTVNPVLPDWEEDLRRCHEEHKFRGIRLHPGYQGYTLAEPAFARLLALAAERKLLVQLVPMMEDERTQHPSFRVPAVDLAPLPAIVKSMPGLRLVVLNAFRKLSLDDAANLSAAGEVAFDIAMLEGVDRVATLVEKVGLPRVLFGSHFPLFYLESAALKLKETELPSGVVRRIEEENARRLLG